LLTDSKSDMFKLSEEAHTFAFEVVFAQLKGYLTNLSNMEVRWVLLVEYVGKVGFAC